MSFAAIADRSQGLNSADAAALALAALDARDRQCGAAAALPSAEHIALSPAGAVVLTVRGPAGDNATTATAGTAEKVTELAGLLRLLLGLDARPGSSRADIPGALLLLMARATGHIDLPPPSYTEFRAAIRRFGSPDPSTLAAIHRTYADPSVSTRPGTQPGTATRPAPHSSPVTSPGAHSTHVTYSTADWDSMLSLTPVLDPYRSRATRPRRRHVREAVASLLVVAAASAAFLTVAIMRPPAGRSPSAPSAAASIAAARPPVSRATAAANDAPDARRASSPDVVTAGPLLSSTEVGVDVFSPSFSDPGELLFHAGRDRAALMRASFDPQGRPRVETVLRDGAANYHAVPSPDGRWLAFDSDRDGARGVYVAGPDAADARRISGEGYAAVPRWSPDGRMLAFIKAETDRPRVWNVWVADLESGVLEQVSRHRVGQAWGASWFPDGQRLAYSVEDALIISDLRSGAMRVTPSPLRRALVRTPAVSPDGRRIVFQVHGNGVWLLDVQTGRTRRVLSDAAAEEFAWSPDGERIVYHTRRGGAWSLWQLSLSSS